MASVPRPVTDTVISTAQWGIPITDAVNANTDAIGTLNSTVRQYPTQAAILADTTAPNGLIALALDNYSRWIRRGGIWEPFWPRLVNATQGYTSTPFGTALADIPNSGIAVPYYANHRYYVHAFAFGYMSGAPAAAAPTLQVTDTANTIVVQTAQHMSAGGYVSLNVLAYVIPTLAVTYKLRLNVTAGQIQMSAASQFFVIDYGPS